MTFISSRIFRQVVLCAAVAGFSCGTIAHASTDAADAAPVDLDAPDTELDTADAQATVAAADATAAALVRATPALAQRVQGGDTQFRSLFAAWQQMDGPADQAIAIPSRRPVDAMSLLTSSFGVRNDPFNGRRARHNGIDIPGPIGTPIYATADGIIGRAQWVNGYGNFVEIEHGNAIETRYGHMSRLNVTAGQHVHRGDVVGFMGSTGRSTGSHLHYEVRIGGAPVNPVPFVADDGVMVAAAGHGATALGGPRE